MSTSVIDEDRIDSSGVDRSNPSSDYEEDINAPTKPITQRTVDEPASTLGVRECGKSGAGNSYEGLSLPEPSTSTDLVARPQPCRSTTTNSGPNEDALRSAKEEDARGYRFVKTAQKRLLFYW